MSLTFNRVPDGNDEWGRTHVRLYDVVLDTSYPLTNGYVINAIDVGLKFFKGATVVGSNKAGGAVLPVIDLAPVSTVATLPTSLAFRLFLPTGGATAPATLTAPVAAASAGTIVVTNGAITVTNGAITTDFPTSSSTPMKSSSEHPAFTSTQATTTAAQASTTAVFTPTTGGALTAGIGKEVGNTTDVSSLIYRVMFFG